MTIIRGRGGSGSGNVYGGTATIPVGYTEVTVTHSLGVAPTWVLPAPTTPPLTITKAAANIIFSVPDIQGADLTFDYAYAL